MSYKSLKSFGSLNTLKSKRSKRYKRKDRSHRSFHSRSKSFYTPLKSISITKSDQGEEGTCLAHACAHLIVKNVFEKIMPLRLSNGDKALYELHSCNNYLKTHELSQIHHDIKDKCSVQGYHKILLFLYVYFTAYENFVLKGKKQFLSPIVTFVLQLEYIPKIFDQTVHLPLLLSLLSFMKKRITDSHIKFDTVDIYSQDVIIIRKILDAGFYVAMNLVHAYQRSNQSQSPDSPNPGHVSTIVAHTPSHFIVKNTWDEKIDYVSYKDLNDVILVYSSIRWKIQNYFVVLPIFENMDLYDGFREDYVTDLEIEEREAHLYKKWVFDYVSNFKKKKPSFY
jgi:hypothetical protein